MSYDHGHVSPKALALDTTGNAALGLRIVRTSVDHGTALRHRVQGRARSSSLADAVRLGGFIPSHGDGPTVGYTFGSQPLR